MEDLIVEYKFKNANLKGDLVCGITRFMDTYLLYKSDLFYTYLYNDLTIFSNKDELQIAFRVPGATRGGIVLERLDQNRFKIKQVRFNEDVCFGEFKCYNETLREDIKCFIDKVLDFSNVELLNNKEVDQNE